MDVIYFVDLGFNINNGNLALVGGAWTVIDYEISIYGFHKNGNVLMFEGSVESPPFKEHVFIPKPYQDAPYANAYTALAKIGANGIKTNFKPQDQ